MLGWDDNIILPVVQREKDSCGASAEPRGSEDIQVIHTYHSVCTEDLVIRSEGFPDVQPGDILEIYHEEETFSRLLLQVKPESLYPENNLQNIVPRDTVYTDTISCTVNEMWGQGDRVVYGTITPWCTCSYR